MKRILVVLLTLIVLLCMFSACSKAEDPNAGRYTAIACIYEGEDIGVEGEYLELADGGTGTLFFYQDYDLTWELSGTELSVQIDEKQYNSTLEDETLVFELDGLVFVCTKNGIEKPIDKYLAAYGAGEISAEALYITEPDVYSGSGITVSASDIEMSSSGELHVYFTVVNETANAVDISSTDITVNGYAMKGCTLSGTAKAGETLYVDVTVPADKLSTYNIIVVAALSLELEVYSEGERIVQTGNVEIPTNNYGYQQDQMCSVLLR